MERIAKPLIFLLAFAALAFAQEKRNVGVLPSMGSVDGVSLDMLTKELRAIAVKTLPVGSFDVMSQENIMRRLGGSEGYLTACRETEGCIAELGKMAEVDYVARCNANMVEGVMMMDVEVYNTNTGGIVGSFNSYSDNAKKTSELIAIMRERAPEIFKKILEAPVAA
jgi:hypothetical protein